MRVFVAGATGATGTVFVPMAEKAGIELVLHVRPQSKDKTPLGDDPRARIFALDDAGALKDALAGCDALVSFVGTMRARFSAGDTYESSDLGSAQKLADGAKAAGVPRFLLLSSHGAGGPGGYLKMKAECERIVKDSGLKWVIFRPSMLESPTDAADSNHGKRRKIPGLGAAMSVIGAIPGLGGWADDAKPIGIDVLCRAFLAALKDEAMNGTILEGRDLWRVGSDR